MLTIVTPPQRLPLYPEDVKRYLRVTHDEENFLIQDLIESVTVWLAGRDGWLGRSLITQTLELSAPLPWYPGFVGPCWDRAGCIVLPRPPYLAIESVSCIDSAGGEIQLAPAMYSTAIGGDGLARLTFHSGVLWIGNSVDPATVRVRYRAGYGPSADYVDHGIRQAILMTVARLYANRGDGLTADFREDRFVQSLFAPYRVWS
ncbi:hypothetical protein AAII07_54350 [Microvirga sp. 0TCS3.31]